MLNGHFHVDSFLDWMLEVENVFDYMQILEAQQVKLVAYKLRGGTSAWWEQMQNNRRRQGKQPVCICPKIKRLMRARFPPPDYEQILYQQYQNYKQEMRAKLRGNKLGDTLGGLCVAIQDKVSLHPVWPLSEAINLSMKIKMQLARPPPRILNQAPQTKTVVQHQQTNDSRPPPYSRMQRGESSTQNIKVPMHKDGERNNPYTRPMIGKCFWCNQLGHRSNECPTRHLVLVIEEGDEDPREGESNEDGIVEEFVKGDEGEPINCTRRKKSRHSIFKTCCIVNNKNIVSKALVNALELKVDKHLQPYKISWIQNGAETKTSNICHVPFSIGKCYQDEIMCDVMEMGACHILLGRSWQFDVGATYKGQDNIYSFWWRDQKIVLMPIRDKGPNFLQHHILQKQVEDLLHKGLIWESMSPWAKPALITLKKDGSWRMSDEWKTAFKTKEGLYVWLVMLFGLSNVASTFMRIMHQDILIYSHNEIDHLSHLREVLL
ncbi:hypothetical protein I3760_13G059700, partial [Carya illinoinensis]